MKQLTLISDEHLPMNTQKALRLIMKFGCSETEKKLRQN